MSVSISVSPIDFTSLTGVSPLVLQPSSTATTVAVASLLTNNSSVVDLSPLGQAASAASTFGNDLTSLLTATTDTNPATVFDTATSLVDAFNSFQNQLGSLPTTGQTLPSAALTGTSLANLGTIGITVQNAATPATTASLSIDPTTLTTAATTQTASTQELLTQATQSLLDQVSAFEETITGTANTVIQTTAFAVPPTANTATGTLTTAAPANPTIATQPAATAAATVAIPAATTATATTTLATAANDDTVAADIRAEANRQALQNLIDDPATRAANLLSDPNYAAMIAAAHLADFVSMMPVNDPTALARDIPGAVLPATPTPSVSYSNENAGGTEAYRYLVQTTA